LVFGCLGGFRKRIVSAICAGGVERWVKLFINLRSSCITDFVERGYKEKTLDAIFGALSVIPAQAGIQRNRFNPLHRDSRFRGKDTWVTEKGV